MDAKAYRLISPTAAVWLRNAATVVVVAIVPGAWVVWLARAIWRARSGS